MQSYKPHDYQEYATNFILSHPACGLLLDMGLGKTVITLTALWSLLLDCLLYTSDAADEL